MPRSRTNEMPQRQSARGPPSLRTSSSDPNPGHHRPRTERSREGRPLIGPQSDPPLTQKKLGTRIADLESQLGQAQAELKSLKDQLIPTESAKKAAQDQLEKKPKKQQNVPEPELIQERHSVPLKTQSLNKESENIPLQASDDVQQETDVFEVTVEKTTFELKTELEISSDQDECKKIKSFGLSTILEPEDPVRDELRLKNDEIICLSKLLEQKDRDLEAFREENEKLKSQLDEKSRNILSAQAVIEELTMKLNEVGREMENSKSNASRINEKLEATEKAKEELETEMKSLRVQTDQWRKAADAAALVLAGGVEVSGGRRISERCGSMDKQYGNGFDSIGRYGGYLGSSGLVDDTDHVFGGGKRKGSGVRMFGDLWKKKGQK